MLKGTDGLGNCDQAIPSRGETLAPLGAPVRENPAAADGRHALAESMPALADEIAGLEGAFHGSPLSNYEPAVYGFAQVKSTPGAAFMGCLKTASSPNKTLATREPSTQDIFSLGRPFAVGIAGEQGKSTARQS
jgi:hypothetical protein|tara:strand:- start:4156 stop:4557 length:402 start_codon:yes stop_codon:yes gene_type:complete